MPVPHRHRTEVLWCFKYPIFVFNLLIWFIGIGILAVGIWSWSEKDRFSNLSRITHLALDPAFILIIIGVITFFIGFTGCVGALRELPALLTLYVFSLLFLLLFEVSFVVIFTNFKDWIKTEATEGFQTFIVHYREDPDQQNLIDWVQEEWLQCCGIEGPKDWDKNNYFNCSSQEIGSREACGVPFSCCKRKPNEIIKNKQCGYDVRKSGYTIKGARWVMLFDEEEISGKTLPFCSLIGSLGFLYSNKRTSLLLTQDEIESPIYEQGCIKALDEWVDRHYLKIFSVALVFVIIQSFDASKIIYEKGCIQALEDWFEHNLLLITAGLLLSTFIKLIAVLQTQRFRTEIEAYKENWY